MKTRIIASLAAILTATATFTGLTSTAHATGGLHPANTQDPVTTIEIHKFEQPENLGQTATGTPQDTTGLTPVSGATFIATLVPGIDVTTGAGMAQARSLTTEEADRLIAGATPSATDTTDTAGNATLSPLGAGLYYVEETAVPVGYAGAAPFLVPLPFENPSVAGDLLSTVHVYPKNAPASIQLSVNDQDAVTLGDTVHWVSHSSIPYGAVLDGYRVEQRINEHLALIGPANLASGVSTRAQVGNAPSPAHASRATLSAQLFPAAVDQQRLNRAVAVEIDCGTVSGCPSLKVSTHYTVSSDEASRVLTVQFTAAGLRALEQASAKHRSARVAVHYDTVVLTDGVHVNEAILYPSSYAIEHGRGVSNSTSTKWGPLSVLVHEHGNSANPIAGAGFKLYLSEEDALAGRNPITVNGVSEWFTDAHGRLIIEGLRFSGFVNGLDRDVADPLYRFYWMVPTVTPPGWEWVNPQPQAGSVNDAIQFQTLIFDLVQDDDTDGAADGPDDVDETDDRDSDGASDTDGAIDGADDGHGADALPVTGAQLAGFGILAAVLIGGGSLALIGRRKRDSEHTVEE